MYGLAKHRMTDEKYSTESGLGHQEALTNFEGYRSETPVM